MLSENFMILDSNAEKTEYLPEFEIAVHWKTISRRSYATFILRALIKQTSLSARIAKLGETFNY